MLRAALLLASLAPPSAALAPCTAPPGVVPAVSEGLCYTEVVPTNPSGVSIRNYVSGNPNATMAVASAQGSYQTGIQYSIAGSSTSLAQTMTSATSCRRAPCPL